MPVLTLTLAGANGKAHNWVHVSKPLGEILTLLNVTKLDYLNFQDYGVRPHNIRFHAKKTGGYVLVYNDSGAQIDEEKIIYFSEEHASLDTIPEITEAFTGAVAGAWRPAMGITIADVANGAEGTIATHYELEGVDTSGAAGIGSPVYLDTVVGGWTLTAPAVANRLQVIGMVLDVHASTGRIQFDFPGYRVPYEYIGQVE